MLVIFTFGAILRLEKKSMSVKVIAKFDIAYERGGTKFVTADSVTITVPLEMPFFDVVDMLDEVIQGKYGNEVTILGDVKVSRYATASSSKGGL